MTRFALVVALAASIGCHSANPNKDADGPAPALPPVDAPASLLAEGTIAAPDATWLRLQRGLGGGMGMLPTSLGGLICAASGLDAKLGAEISGTSPAYLVVAGHGGAPSWVLAARLVEERRARPLFEGPTAIFQANDAGAGVMVLAGKGAPAPQRRVAVGIAPGGWLVLGPSAAALADLAPYATRTLPSRTTGSESIAIDVPRAALQGELGAAAAHGWNGAKDAMIADDVSQRSAHGGRAPDFGEPRAIVGALDGWMQGRLGALRDLRGTHVAIDVGDDTVTAVLSAPPASSEGAASSLVAAIHPGDTAPLASLPRETVLALLTRDDAVARATEAAGLESTIVATLGPRLAAPDAKRVHAAIDDWGVARGDWATLALTLTPSERGVVADVASSDPARTARGVREAMDLVAHVPAFRDPLEGWLGARDLTLGAAEVPGGGHASTATFVTASPITLAWTPGSADLKLALGPAPLPLLAPTIPASTLGDDPTIRALLGSLGSVSSAIVAQPGRMPGCTATGGIAVAWGTRPDSAGKPALWGMTSASDSSLRCLAKSLF